MRRGGDGKLSLLEEEETSDDDKVQSGADKSEVEEGQMVAPSPHLWEKLTPLTVSLKGMAVCCWGIWRPQ